jgi:hypothetical protein
VRHQRLIERLVGVLQGVGRLTSQDTLLLHGR